MNPDIEKTPDSDLVLRIPPKPAADIQPQRISSEHLKRVSDARRKKDKLAIRANVALARFKLAEAEFQAVHHEIVIDYDLKATDGYHSETGEITHDVQPPPQGA